MPELRTDWLTGRSILVAESRAQRPSDFSDLEDRASECSPTRRATGPCPFCAGNEAATPPAVYEHRNEGGEWLVRVVPNAFPAVSTWSQGDPPPGGFASENPIAGAHEVIIECPSHAERLADLSGTQLPLVWEAYANRLRFWRAAEPIRYALVFKNQGPRAGASLAHAHSQLMALPFVPASVAAELSRAADHLRAHRKCAYCALIEQELAAGDRIVFNNTASNLVAFCPYASLQPYEVWLMPTRHEATFEEQGSLQLGQVATAVWHLVAQMETVAPHVQYNMLLRTAPVGEEAVFHWRIELLPRVNSLAGLEIATGVHINPVSPESAAKLLRGD
ncbi:MAG: DUF4921 family protein [Pirellulales bacterium]|nr:DUF4921 family protein [Pirellulales bacterium]